MQGINGTLIDNKFKNHNESTSKFIVKNKICDTTAASPATETIFDGKTKQDSNSTEYSYHKGVKVAKIDTNKNTAITKLKIIANNKTTLATTKGDLIAKILNETPTRAFDIYHLDKNYNSENTIDTDNRLPQIKDNLQIINKWLQKNKNEIVFLALDQDQANNKSLDISELIKIFGERAVLTPNNFDANFPNNNGDVSNIPTLNELISNGIRIVIGYKNNQNHKLKIESRHEIELCYQDNISIFTPQHYTIKQNIDIYNVPDTKKLISNIGKDYGSILLQLGTSIVTFILAVTGFLCVFQGYSNEKKIRQQDKIMPKEISQIDVASILLSRQKIKKNATANEITKPITADDVKAEYKKKQLFSMKKNTFLFGGSAIVGIISALAALSLLLPITLPIFFSATTTLLMIGFTILLITMWYTNKRFNNAIEQVFKTSEIKDILQKHVDTLNSKLEKIVRISKNEDNLNSKTYIKNMIKLENAINQISKGENVTRKATLISNAGLLTTKIMPGIVATICSGANIVLGVVLVMLESILNCIRHRKKLDNISQFILEATACDYNKKQKRKLMLFGYTAIERFIYQDKTRLIEILKLPNNSKFKDVFAKLIQPENKDKFEKYLLDFTIAELNKALKSFAEKQNHVLSFEEIIQDRKQLRQLLRQYIISKTTKSISNCTLISGILSTIILIGYSIFLGIFFSPLIVAIAGICIALIGLIVTKIVAIKETNIFSKRITTLLDTKSENLNAIDLIHKQNIENLILSWEEILYKAKYLNNNNNLQDKKI